MKKFKIALVRSKAMAALMVIGSLLGTVKVNAQVFLTFTGGHGSEVTVSWSSPITYTLTGSTLNSGVNPYFVFQAVTNSQSIFQTQGTPAAPSPTYTSTGAGSTDGIQTIDSFSAPPAHNDVANGDIVFLSFADTAPTLLTVGDVFSLTAGSLSYTGSPNTSSTYLGALPANGFYNTIIVDAAYQTLGVSAIPEPSTYAVLMGLAALGFVTWRRRRSCVLVRSGSNAGG